MLTGNLAPTRLIALKRANSKAEVKIMLRLPSEQRTWKVMLMGGLAHGLRCLVVATRLTSARRLCSHSPGKRFVFQICGGRGATT